MQSHFNVISTSINKRAHFSTNERPWLINIYLNKPNIINQFSSHGKSSKSKSKSSKGIPFCNKLSWKVSSWLAWSVYSNVHNYNLFFGMSLYMCMCIINPNLMALIQKLHCSWHACKPSSNDSHLELRSPIVFRFRWIQPFRSWQTIPNLRISTLIIIPPAAKFLTWIASKKWCKK